MKLKVKQLKAKQIGQVIFFLFLSLTFLILPGKALYQQVTVKSEPEAVNFSPTATPIPLPLKKTNTAEPALTAAAAAAVDVVSGATLYSKNEDIPLWPASITKLMTALVALEKYKPEDVLTAGKPLTMGRVMGLVEGEKITMENLLYGLLVHSANDAAYALAENYPGSVDLFVSAMNKKALVLKLENTHFTNPAGFDDSKQYTTARDLVLLSLYALKNPLISKMVGLPAITVPDADFTHFHPLTNVNSLLGRVPGVAGVKTGWTENAKENLVNLTKRDGQEILTVVLGSEDRFGETQTLTNWIFENYQWRDFQQ